METKMINIKINGNDYQAPDGITILDACKRTGIEIPTLCYLEDVSRNSSCGVCVVEVKGARSLVRSCTACVHEGTEIKFFPLNESIKFEVIEGKIRILIHQETITLRKGQVLTCPTKITLILTTKEETVLLLTISKDLIQQSVN